jgi:hypothetical protein
VREWTLTLPSELSFWELESQWTPESSEGNCKSQNPLNLRFFNTIEKLLKRGCFKWVRMTHLDIWNTSYGQKKGRETIWLSTTKSQELLDFLLSKWHATYRWKAFNEGYNFVLDLISIRGLHTKLWGPKVAGVPTMGILGIPRQNVIRIWASWRGTKYNIKGKVVASLEFGPWRALWVRGCMWLVLAPKMLKLCINQLVVGFVQIHVND